MMNSLLISLGLLIMGFILVFVPQEPSYHWWTPLLGFVLATMGLIFIPVIMLIKDMSK